MKTCRKCELAKPLTEYYREAGSPDGYRQICKTCKNTKTAEWREKKKKEYNEYMRVYRRTHPAKYEQERNRAMRNRYGINMDQYAVMLVAQNGVCAICENPPKPNRPLYIDHHHGTGKIRKLLCASCNRSIAIFDDEKLFAKALTYIATHQD